MTRWAPLVLVACTVMIGCGDDNPSSPSSAPIVFVADLRPANEVPAIANAESSGRGSAQITIDQTTRTPTFFVQLSDFPGDTRAIASHIHIGAAGVNGGIVVNSGMATTQLSNRITEITSTGAPVDAALLQAIINNPAGYYFNVHSTLNPGGVARGQLVRIQ